ncbi:pentatricopeptide repeat (PPR) superfamily protein [Actinidia rufa]|uniref:Pentatricopeptide repeat (PPR) superfamily protein n=1 Tax=Actinidia rufa TaxID=165716 RepID=A0A7J0FWA2_9ERIC|nr:pentatricopeptide repeat (PPR) superfamily protein [Actinidia rufa]
MRKITAVKPPPPLFNPKNSLHTSPSLSQWKLRDESKLTRPEFVDRICRLLVLRRLAAVENLPLALSDDLVDAVLRQLRLNPKASIQFFELASRQQNYRPNVKAYCKIVHIVARGRMFDETRSFLNELVGFCESKRAGFMIWDELVRVYREFSFSPTVFDMILKVYAKKGMPKNALYVFDNMGKCGRVPSLQSCNSLLNCLVKNGELHNVFCVYDQMIRVGNCS